MNADKVYIGIDPGYGKCGWGVIRVLGNRMQALDCGVIETLSQQPFPARLRAIHQGLASLLETYQPQEAAVEEIFFSKNVKTAINVGQARGVAILACSQAGLQIAEYKPVEIKMAVTGNGIATKSQIQHMVQVLLGLKNPVSQDDAADALAVAICHAHTCPQLKGRVS